MRYLLQIRQVLKLAAVALALVGGAQAYAAAQTRTLCIYDPIGANGVAFQSLQDYVSAALDWGVQFDAKPYTNEEIAAADFKNGKCDAVELTGMHNTAFVKFAGSLDMLGGLQTYDEEHRAIEAISSPRAAQYMSEGNYETVGVVPGGRVFLFARHKSNLTSLQKAAGRKVAVMAFDRQAIVLANAVGAVPVPATISTLSPMFNNGTVEYAYAPSFAYKALEFYQGLGTEGGIADYVLGMLSLQIDIHKDRFPAGFGQKSRSWVADNMWDHVLKRIQSADSEIPDGYWVHVDATRSKSYELIVDKVRQMLWGDNWYDHTMQNLLKQIRASSTGSTVG
jgi:hypothetical protein